MPCFTNPTEPKYGQRRRWKREVICCLFTFNVNTYPTSDYIQEISNLGLQLPTLGAVPFSSVFSLCGHRSLLQQQRNLVSLSCYRSSWLNLVMIWKMWSTFFLAAPFRHLQIYIILAIPNKSFLHGPQSTAGQLGQNAFFNKETLVLSHETVVCVALLGYILKTGFFFFFCWRVTNL